MASKLQRRPVAGTGALAPASGPAQADQEEARDPQDLSGEAGPTRPTAFEEPAGAPAPAPDHGAPGTGPAQSERKATEAPDDSGETGPGPDPQDQWPGPRWAAERTPTAETRTAGRRRATARRRTASPGDPADLWQRVLDACESARRNSSSWTAYSPNLPENLWTEVNRWLLRARRASRRRDLAANHVIEVALSRMPRDPDGYIDGEAVAAKAREWLEANPAPAKRKSTGSRLTAEMADAMVDLSKQLDLQTYETVDKWAAEAAYVQEFLDTFSEAPFPAAAPGDS